MRLGFIAALNSGVLLSACALTHTLDPDLLTDHTYVWTEAPGQNQDTYPSIAFMPDHHVAGDAGCNRFQGPWRIDEHGHIDFSGLALTMRLCPPEAMQAEDAFMKNMGLTKTLVMNGHMLEFFNQEGDLLMRLEPQTKPHAQ